MPFGISESSGITCIPYGPCVRMRLIPIMALLLCIGPWLAGVAEASVATDRMRAGIAQSSLDEASRQAANEYIDAADIAGREADSLVTLFDELRAENAGQPLRIEQLQAALKIDREQTLLEWSARLPADADGETLEGLLAQQRRRVKELQAQIDATSDKLALILARPQQAASDRVILRAQVEDLSVALAARDNEPGLLFQARQLQRAQELRRAKAELDLRVSEQDSAVQRQRGLELTLRELRHRLALEQRRIDVLQQRIADLGSTELQARIEQLLEQEQALAGSAQVVMLAAAENIALGSELVENNERLSRDRRTLVSIEEERDYVTEALRDSRTRLDLGRANEQVGRWLWTERRSLEPPARLRHQLDKTRIALADMRLRVLSLNDQSEQLEDIPRALKALRVASRAGADDEQSDAGAEQLLPPLLRDRAELLGLLAPLLERRINSLQHSESALQDRLVATEALLSLLDRHLLWLPSHRVVDAQWLTRVPEGFRDLIKPSRFATTLKLSARSIGKSPLMWVMCLILLMVLMALRILARRRILALTILIDQQRDPHYRVTGIAFLWTVFGALPVPVAIGLLGFLLQQLGTPGRYSDSLGHACMALVIPLLVVQLLRWTLLDGGLADTHFGWRGSLRQALQRWLPTAAVIVLPMHFIASLAFVRRSDLALDVQARLAVAVSSVILAWAFWRLLKAGMISLGSGMGDKPSAIRFLLRGLVPLLLLTTAGLALAGYIYSSGVLLQSLLESISLIIVVAIALGMLARWFQVGEQRLAQRQREAAARDALAATDEGAEIVDDDITVKQVKVQTATLLRVLRVSLLALGLLWVWVDVLPAIYRLDEFAMWHFTDVGPDGNRIEQPVTLAAMLLGIFWLVVTMIGSRNLPGLLEISLLSRVGVDAASRYMITSLLRYVIVIGGTLVGLSFLGMRWSQLQWMAAALTVGLGFGLQEIFANFVSGIILLFERPFRVGDVITVGDMSGRVTRIRTRATTILDFDNKEIVMPNKTFITGHLTNWGLSDTNTRVIIKVGVAYGTDPVAVRKLLLKAAAEDPRVVAEPEPSCWFLAFGASSLDFELRVFVASLSDRLESQNGLNTRITELFAEHGIEIAFPQMDLHVRDMPPPSV